MTAAERKIPRVSPNRAWEMLEDQDALLICAYDDEDKCRDLKLPGSISRNELGKREDALEKDRWLVFYCA